MAHRRTAQAVHRNGLLATELLVNKLCRFGADPADGDLAAIISRNDPYSIIKRETNVCLPQILLMESDDPPDFSVPDPPVPGDWVVLIASDVC